jgi:predicted O-linked N-acetylglucosamine transferase (SPINDLY family)
MKEPPGIEDIPSTRERLLELLESLKQALVSVPDNVASHAAIAEVWRKLGQPHLAIRHATEAARRDPTCLAAFRVLGDTHAMGADWQQAGAAYYECVKRNPRDARSAIGLARAFAGLRQPDQALRALRQAAALSPGSLEIAVHLGSALAAGAAHVEAIEAFQGALRLEPGNLRALHGLAAAQLHAQLPAASAETYRHVLDRRADDAEALAGLGLALLEQGRASEAEAVFLEALRLRPFRYEMLRGLHQALVRQGRMEEAGQAARRAAAAAPVPTDRVRHELAMLLYDAGHTPMTIRRRTLDIVAPGRVEEQNPPWPAARDRRPALRIGWLSSDFRHHVVAINLRPVIRHLDPAGFEQFFYADSRVDDPLTEFFRLRAAGWRIVEGLSDAEVADLIRRDGIDILVVLAGRFDANRPLFAQRRASPVQISYHDPATSGLAQMDYLVSDRYLTPRSQIAAFTERVLRLPSFYIADPPEDAPPVSPLPLAAARGATLACFNNPLKIGGAVLKLWAGILGRIPGCRLALHYHQHYREPEAKSRILEELARHGIPAERIALSHDIHTSQEHLSTYRDVDLALDPFPFSGSTTTFEALWMGVPVITRPGETMASRWTASMLRAVGLDGFIAGSDDEYLAIACRWLEQPDSLAALRQTLRARVASSPLCDGRSRSRQLGRLFRAVAKRQRGRSTEVDPGS